MCIALNILYLILHTPQGETIREANRYGVLAANTYMGMKKHACSEYKYQQFCTNLHLGNLHHKITTLVALTLAMPLYTSRTLNWLICD